MDMRRLAFLILTIAVLASQPARAGVVALPRSAVGSAPLQAGAAAAAAVESYARFSESLNISHLSLSLALPHLFPSSPRPMEMLQGKELLEIGTGRQAQLARSLVQEHGLASSQVHGVDPYLDESAAAEFPQGNMRSATAEDLPPEWDNKFDVVLSFFVFNPEIVHGETSGMGKGIDVKAAARRISSVLKPGARALIMTGATGMDPDTQQAFGAQLRPVRTGTTGVYVFEKPALPAVAQ